MVVAMLCILDYYYNYVDILGLCKNLSFFYCKQTKNQLNYMNVPSVEIVFLFSPKKKTVK